MKTSLKPHMEFFKHKFLNPLLQDYGTEKRKGDIATVVVVGPVESDNGNCLFYRGDDGVLVTFHVAILCQSYPQDEASYCDPDQHLHVNKYENSIIIRKSVGKM